jgi:hypothetical protein
MMHNLSGKGELDPPIILLAHAIIYGRIQFVSSAFLWSQV